MNKKLNLSRINLDVYLLLILFLVTPFIQSDTSDASQPDYLLSVPPFISIIASYIRWIILGFLVIRVCLFWDRYKVHLNWIYISFCFFYLFQLIYSLFTLTDLWRFLGLFIVILALPLVISRALNDYKTIVLSFIFFLISAFVAISFFVGYGALFFGFRFQGILGNSNMYGFAAISWLIFSGLNDRHKILSWVLIILIVISAFLSGSRVAYLGLLVIFIANLRPKVIFFMSLFCLILYLTPADYFEDFEYLMVRFIEFGDIVESSGRQEVWDKALYWSFKNPLFGNGMNAPDLLVGSGNIHNAYLRYLLTMGIPMTIISLFALTTGLVLIFSSRGISMNIKSFFLILIFANFGEDYFVGIGSSFLIYFVFFLGIAIHEYNSSVTYIEKIK